MQDEVMNTAAALFTGQWIGQTQGHDMPAHLWEIQQYGDYLVLRTRWEGETSLATFSARLVPGEAAFIIDVPAKNKATLVDKQHFVIPGWCWGTTSGEAIGRFDVVFSRPGIAELTARAAYLKNQEKTATGETTD